MSNRGHRACTPDGSYLPPRDAYWFTRLQGLTGRRHQDTVASVIRNTVDLFGTHFIATLEGTMKHVSVFLLTITCTGLSTIGCRSTNTASTATNKD
jgi:hypothetical protein